MAIKHKWRYKKGPYGNTQQDIPRTWNEETDSRPGKDYWNKREGELKHQPTRHKAKRY